MSEDIEKKNNFAEAQESLEKQEVTPEDSATSESSSSLAEGEENYSSVAEEQEKDVHQQNKEYEDLLKRQQAEFENYRKRTLKEKDDFYKYANFDLLKELLDIVDNYQRALEVEIQDEQVKSFLKGFNMIKDQFDGLLDRYKVKTSTQVGDQLDVNLHQAIQFEEIEVEQEELVGETVSEIYQQGYLLHDRIIRLATVKVKRNILAEADQGKECNQQDAK